MIYNNDFKVPNMFSRIISIWYRHVRVYCSNFISNAVPPFFEPLIFLAGLGIGIGSYITKMGSVSYILFLATGLIVTSSMYTATFEGSYGTFIRLEFDKVYDGMLGSPISSKDIIIGEILFAGTKGMFFSFAVLIVVWIAQIVTYPLSILSIFVGFITGLMFGSLSMFITSFIRNINHFNFYFTGLISPMFFFSGIVFPIESLPNFMMIIANIVPLTHVVNISRAVCISGNLQFEILYDILYCIVFTIITGFFAVRGLTKRMTN